MSVSPADCLSQFQSIEIKSGFAEWVKNNGTLSSVPVPPPLPDFFDNPCWQIHETFWQLDVPTQPTLSSPVKPEKRENLLQRILRKISPKRTSERKIEEVRVAPKALTKNADELTYWQTQRNIAWQKIFIPIAWINAGVLYELVTSAVYWLHSYALWSPPEGEYPEDWGANLLGDCQDNISSGLTILPLGVAFWTFSNWCAQNAISERDKRIWKKWSVMARSIVASNSAFWEKATGLDMVCLHSFALRTGTEDFAPVLALLDKDSLKTSRLDLLEDLNTCQWRGLGPISAHIMPTGVRQRLLQELAARLCNLPYLPCLSIAGATSGKPGSVFEFIGNYFPPRSSVKIIVNDQELPSPLLPVSKQGTVTFFISSDNAAEGTYSVSLGLGADRITRRTASITFILQDTAPSLHPQTIRETTVNLPAQITSPDPKRSPVDEQSTPLLPLTDHFILYTCSLVENLLKSLNNSSAHQNGNSFVKDLIDFIQHTEPDELRVNVLKEKLNQLPKSASL